MVILCSECYDALGVEYFSNIIPQATCQNCGRLCLGYYTRDEVPEPPKQPEREGR